MNIEYYFILINSSRECNTIRKEVKVIKKQGQPLPTSFDLNCSAAKKDKGPSERVAREQDVGFNR